MNMNKQLILKVVTVLVLMAGVSAALLMRQKPLTAHLVIEVTPKSSSVTLNGKKTRTGTANLRPGTYRILVSHPGFKDNSNSVTLSKNDTKYVGLVLESNSDSTASWYADHPEDQSLAEKISGKNLKIDAESQKTTLPLIKELPFIDRIYRVDYGVSKKTPNDPAAVALYITYYGDQSKQDALAWLKFKGYTPENTEFIFVDGNAR